MEKISPLPCVDCRALPSVENRSDRWHFECNCRIHVFPASIPIEDAVDEWNGYQSEDRYGWSGRRASYDD